MNLTEQLAIVGEISGYQPPMLPRLDADLKPSLGRRVATFFGSDKVADGVAAYQAAVPQYQAVAAQYNDRVNAVLNSGGSPTVQAQFTGYMRHLKARFADGVNKAGALETDVTARMAKQTREQSLKDGTRGVAVRLQSPEFRNLPNDLQALQQ